MNENLNSKITCTERKRKKGLPKELLAGSLAKAEIQNVILASIVSAWATTKMLLPKSTV